MNNFYQKNKSIILYLFWGIVTTVVNIVIYWFLTTFFPQINYQISNFIATAVSILVAYISNRKYVFDSKAETKKEISAEFSKFIGARIFSWILESVILFIGELLHLPKIIVKIFAQFVVIAVNYVLSKLVIFKK